MIYNFNTPAAILTGAGARFELLNQVKRLKGKRALFVTDSYIKETGLLNPMTEQLTHAGVECRIFSGVQPDPTVENVNEGLKVLLEHQADIIIGVGGGSPMDAAKAISVLATNPAPLSQYMGYHKIPAPGIPMIVIPTTAGTGSEATKVTVITDTERNVKMMIFDAHLLPTVALVDFELSMSMPPSLTAHVGVDTLTHGIEAYVSQKANALTDPIALSCIELVAKHLHKAWVDPENRKAREGMSIAACQGGMAFTNSSVCLVHGMSRPLGVQFHLPHGLSNAVLLPSVTRFSIPGAIEKYAIIARKMGLTKTEESDENASRALIKGLEQLNQKLGVPKLRECKGMEMSKFESVLDKMAGDALASGSPQNNPVVPTHEQIIELYQEAW